MVVVVGGGCEGLGVDMIRGKLVGAKFRGESTVGFERLIFLL